LLLQLLVGDERVVDVGERVLDRKLIVVERRLLRGFRLRNLTADATERENRADHLTGVAPYARRAGEELRQVRTAGAERTGERNGREVKRLRRADLRVCRNQRFLRLHEIR